MSQIGPNEILYSFTRNCASNLTASIDAIERILACDHDESFLTLLPSHFNRQAPGYLLSLLVIDEAGENTTHAVCQPWREALKMRLQSEKEMLRILNAEEMRLRNLIERGI